MGISIEWTLIERYMNPNAQTAFVNLLRNWDSGFLRVGGGSQDSTPYSADAPNTDSIVTNADFAYLRNTIDILNTRPAFDAAPPWGVVLGAAMTPSSTPANAKAFMQGDRDRIRWRREQRRRYQPRQRARSRRVRHHLQHPVAHRLRDVFRPGGERQLAARGTQYEHRHRGMDHAREPSQPLPVVLELAADSGQRYVHG
jgi:hypothetical protein